MQKVRTIPHTTELERHPLSAMFPEVQGEEFVELCTSLESHGQRETVKLYEGKVLDGWNRVRGLKYISKDIQVEDIEGSDKELAEYCYDLNVTRRNLTKGQRAGIGAALRAEFLKDAKARQKAGKKAKSEKGESAAKAGKATGVSASYVLYADQIKDRAPDLYNKLMNKEITIPQAMAELKKRERLDTMVDELGNELLDKSMRELFFSVSEITDRVLKPLKAALRAAKELKEQDKTGVGDGLDIKMLSKAISTAKGIVLGGMPYCITPPECEDKECKKRGWMTRDEYHTFSGKSGEPEGDDESLSEGEKKSKSKKKVGRKAKSKKAKSESAA